MITHEFKSTTRVILYAAMAAAVIFLIVKVTIPRYPAHPNCQYFGSRKSVETYFKNYKAAWLDANHDGVPCEDIK